MGFPCKSADFINQIYISFRPVISVWSSNKRPVKLNDLFREEHCIWQGSYGIPLNDVFRFKGQRWTLQNFGILGRPFIIIQLSVQTAIRQLEQLLLPLNMISGGSRISCRGGRGPRTGGHGPPEVATFQKFCMSKRKNLDP